MKCYYHQHVDAVGLCYHCNRGLCPECAQAFTRGLACKPHCESAVKAMLTFRGKRLERGRLVLKARSRRSRPITVSAQTRHWLIVSLFTALGIALLAAESFIHSAPLRLVVELGLGGTIVSCAIPLLLRARRPDGGDQ